jgi:hypothetical protein
VITPKKTWREKRLAHEERNDNEDTSHGEGVVGDDTKINMVFELPSEFRVPEEEVAEFALGAKTATFEKPKKLEQHMKPLFVKCYLEGRPVQRIMVDGGASVNVMPMVTFEKNGLM